MKILSELRDIERLSPLVIRILGQNPGPKTLQGTNTYLVGKGPDVILIDSGEPDNDKYCKLLKKAVDEYKLNVKSIVVTHWHADHVGGYPSALKSLNLSLPYRKIPHDMDQHFVDTSQCKPLTDKEEISVPGASLTVHHTPGHTSDSISLLLREENALFCGDSILGESSGAFDNYIDYMNTLRFYKELKPEVIYTGHGIEEKSETIDTYIEHRAKRENIILEFLRKEKSPISSNDLTLKVYEKEGIIHIPLLLLSAQEIVSLVLDKFEQDGTAHKDANGNWMPN